MPKRPAIRDMFRSVLGCDAVGSEERPVVGMIDDQFGLPAGASVDEKGRLEAVSAHEVHYQICAVVIDVDLECDAVIEKFVMHVVVGTLTPWEHGLPDDHALAREFEQALEGAMKSCRCCSGTLMQTT